MAQTDGLISMRTILLILLFISMAHADCLHLYPGGKKIEVPGTTELCNSFYVALFHNRKNATLLTSELLQPGGQITVLETNYRNDPRLYPLNLFKDYANTRQEKGQLVPAYDAASFKEMNDTFLLSNVAPRDPVLHKGEWRQLEAYVRSLVAKAGVPMHVVTGTLYDEKPAMAWRVPIPAAWFKVLYGNTITVYYAENTKDGVILGYSIDWLENKLGYKLR